MKRLILITCLAVLAGAGYAQMYPPSGYEFTDGYITDKSVTLDGVEWNSMCRVSANPLLAWVVADSGKVRSYRLKDTLSLKGAQLVNEFNLGARQRLCDVFFLDSLRGWVVGCVDDGSDSAGRGNVWKTYNGGTYWMPSCDLPCLVYEYNLSFLRVEFSNRYFGWIRGDQDYLYRTTDGGITWIIVPRK
jgi:hypothetical protein